MYPQNVAPLDAEQAAFVQGPVSINAASRNAAFVPSAARGFGCRVDDDGRRLTVFLPCGRCADLLADLRGGGPIAVVFSRPSTHRTLQVKGIRATVAPLARGDRDAMLDYGRSFGGEILMLAWDDTFATAMTTGVGEDAVAAVFVPAALYDQTPGPGAGRLLESAS